MTLIPEQRRLDIWFRDHFRCIYCATMLGFDEMTLDHRLPRSRGGTHHEDNLVACCRACNRDKGDRTVDEWRAMQAAKRKGAPMIRLKIVTDDVDTHLETEGGERIENATVHMTACASWPETRSPLATVSVTDAEMEIKATNNMTIHADGSITAYAIGPVHQGGGEVISTT